MALSVLMKRDSLSDPMQSLKNDEPRKTSSTKSLINCKGGVSFKANKALSTAVEIS